jgi:hypothetical protein
MIPSTTKKSWGDGLVAGLRGRARKRAKRMSSAEQELVESWRAVANAKLREYRRQSWRLAFLAKQGSVNRAAATRVPATRNGWPECGSNDKMKASASTLRIATGSMSPRSGAGRLRRRLSQYVNRSRIYGCFMERLREARMRRPCGVAPIRDGGARLCTCQGVHSRVRAAAGDSCAPL